jgi:ribosomal protein S18 acetylase RimI-like enzyme
MTEQQNHSTEALELRPIVPEDRNFLFRIYAETREEELNLTGWDPGQRQAFLEMQLRAQENDYNERFRDGQFSVVTSNGTPVGRITIGRTDQEIRVVDIIIASEWRSRGFGTFLLQNVLRESTETGKPVRLHVLRHDRAMRLYERLGFRIITDLGISFEMEWRPPA